MPHSILVNKLQSHGLNAYLLRWICDYLTGREQYVLNSVTSGPQPVPSGVPQGSVLGPFLFTLYINDLADLQLSEGSKLVAYADDLLLYKPVEMLTTTECRMLEQMLIIIPFSHTLRFWNSLPPTLAHAPSTSVFKGLIEFYV